MDQNPTKKGGAATSRKKKTTSSSKKPASTKKTTTRAVRSASNNPKSSRSTTNPSKYKATANKTSTQKSANRKASGNKTKRRTIVILGSILGALALILGGLAVWFYLIYNNPEKAMFDGVSNLFRAKNISLNGGGTIMQRDDATGDDIESVILNLESSSSKLPNSTNVSLLIDFANDKSIDLQLGVVEMTDGAIYLKISGIIDSLHRLGVESEVERKMEEVFDALETIDGEWWRVSVRDLLKDVTQNNKIANFYNDLYSCTLDAITRDNSATLVDLYDQNRFIQVNPIKEIDSGDSFLNYRAEAWHSLYEISFDQTALAQFVNNLPETDAAQELFTCYNGAAATYDPHADQISSEDFAEISASDIDLPTSLHLYAEVSQFDHKIRSIQAYSDDESWKNAFAVKLNYSDAAVSTPREYRDITELLRELPFEEIQDNIKSLKQGSTRKNTYEYAR